MITQATTGRRRAKTPAILVIGGGRAITEYLDRHLRSRAACEIVTAALPSDALRQVARRPVPLVICDDSAPSMRSFQLMGEIKALSPETHVVLIVPTGSLDQERRAKQAGADTYIPSTFAFKRLLPILDDVLV
jgi:DNA-binding NtrC family response regulator